MTSDDTEKNSQLSGKRYQHAERQTHNCCSDVGSKTHRKPGVGRVRDSIGYDEIVPGAYLTMQETRCIRALLKDQSYREIAKILGISYRTAASYVDEVREKFHCANKKELIQLFQRVGLKGKE